MYTHPVRVHVISRTEHVICGNDDLFKEAYRNRHQALDLKPKPTGKKSYPYTAKLSLENPTHLTTLLI